MNSTPAAMRRITTAGLVVLSAGLLSGCGEDAETEQTEAIQISGSATVAPITELMASESEADVDVAAEGTTDGFERFCNGETAINNASEAIPGEGQPVNFVELCEENGVDFIELPIGMDTLTVVRHQDNEFATDLTVEELQQIWETDSEITTWSDIRSEWPDEEIELAGRPSGSGTFDVFTHQIMGEAGEIRDDYMATNDLDELVDWTAERENALAFMGIGNYYSQGESESREEISTVAVDDVVPSLENAQDGSYTPLTRPLFIYVAEEALEEDEAVADFIDSYLDSAYDVLPRTFFYRLPEDSYDQVSQRLEDGETGSLYEGDPFLEDSVIDLLG